MNGVGQHHKQDEVFWPQELLPSVVPDTRIFVFGYDANVDGFLSSASQNTIHQHAQSLLSDLADLCDTFKEVSSITHTFT